MKPKLEFKTNIPEKFIFVKMFKQGESEFQGNKSKWFACEVKHKDIEKTLFASQALWNKMNKVAEGDTIEATLAEIETDDKKKHKEWLVIINGVEQHVSKTKEIAETEEAKQEYHKDKEANLPNWDRISWGKCKHAFLVEAFNELIQEADFSDTTLCQTFADRLKNIEVLAEQWANASMGMLNQPLLDKDGELPSERDKEKLPF